MTCFQKSVNQLTDSDDVDIRMNTNEDLHMNNDELPTPGKKASAMSFLRSPISSTQPKSLLRHQS